MSQRAIEGAIETEEAIEGGIEEASLPRSLALRTHAVWVSLMHGRLYHRGHEGTTLHALHPCFGPMEPMEPMPEPCLLTLRYGPSPRSYA